MFLVVTKSSFHGTPASRNESTESVSFVTTSRCWVTGQLINDAIRCPISKRQGESMNSIQTGPSK